MSSNSSGMNLASNQQTTRPATNIHNTKTSQSASLQQLQHKGATKKIPLKHEFINANSLSSSETDLFTSTENLSIEQRYVLRNTPRIEPQGQENFEENLMPINENKSIGRHNLEQRFSSNASTDSLRYAPINRSLSEARTPVYAPVTPSSISNRNSLKESSSNRSSVDVSTGSYNTLIIHNDENMYLAGARELSTNAKKDRPRSCGEQGVQEISEIPDDYLSKSQVLKHLANEMKIPNKIRSDTRDSRASEGKIIREKSKLNLIIEDIESPNKSKSKSLPDLTNISDIADVNVFETLLKENAILKKKLLMCGLKVAKTKQLEGEVANIYQVYEELVQSCNRRERLERMARMQLKENLQKVQSLNRALQAKVDLFQTPLSENQFIEPLFNQYKELLERKERQDVELTAQQATLQEQRRHIGILDAALNNAQSQCRHLEEELRKKQMYIERLTQMIGVSTQNKQCDRRMRLDIETELSKESNRSGSSTGSEQKWQLDNRLNSDKRSFDEKVLSPTSSKLSLEKIQETEKIIAEAKQEKLRYMEEAHCAQRKVTDLQSHLKNLEGKMAEKDAFIRAIKNQKKCSSFDSYNLSSESFGLNTHLYATQPQFNSNNTSFKSATASLSLLDPSSYGESSQKNYNSAMAGVLTTGNYDQSTSSSYNQNLNIQSPSSISGNYSPNGSNYSNNFDPNLNFIVQKSPGFNISAFDNQYEDKQNNESISKFETLQRGLCCLPSLGNKKFTQPLLSDEVSILSTNNSDSFLQTLTHLDQREINRNHDKENLNNKNKTDEIVLLEKQGRCSQKNRNNISGNLAQVTQSVGQNMTDISNIGVLTYQGNPTLSCPPRKERGKSLPPSALPRPPRHPKVQKNNEYERLSDSTKNIGHQHNPSLDNRNFPTKHILTFPKNGQLLQGRDYGSVDINNSSRFMFKTSNVFTKPCYNQTKNCFQRPDTIKSAKVGQDENNSLKRSLLPAVRKINAAGNCNSAHNNNTTTNINNSNNNNSNNNNNNNNNKTGNNINNNNNNNNNNNPDNNNINNHNNNNNNNINPNNNARSSSISNNSNQSGAASSASTSNYKSESSSVSKSSRLQSRTPPKAFQYGNQTIDGPFKSLLPVPHSSTPLLELKGDKSKLNRSSRTSKTGENNYRIQF